MSGGVGKDGKINEGANREKKILKYKRPAFWAILAIAAVCVAVAACSLAGLFKDRIIDLNRNGVGEELRLVEDESMSRQILVIYEDGEQIFWEEGYYVHPGYNSLFLCTLDGEDYLLRYNPVGYTGTCSYHYELFTLENGQENIIKSNEVDFDLNFSMGYHEESGGFDPEAIAAFMEEINWYLAHSRQLLNTDMELLSDFEKAGKMEASLSWLEYGGYTAFTVDDTKSLLENLKAFKEMEEEWAREFQEQMEDKRW